MAFTTYDDLRTSLAALTVTGVTVKKASWPAILNDADMPLMFPRQPRATGQNVALGQVGGLKAATCELVIVVGAFTLDLHEENVERSWGLIDALDTVLRASIDDLGLDGWTIAVTDEEFPNGAVYWVVTATIEASG
jgi:hypothetical protein